MREQRAAHYAQSAPVTPLDRLPLELLHEIEGFLVPSTIVSLSAASHFYHARWNSDRWEDFYNFNVKKKPRKRKKDNNNKNAMASKPTFNTQRMNYNIFALYSEMWKNIELGMLGYYYESTPGSSSGGGLRLTSSSAAAEENSRTMTAAAENSRTMTLHSFFLCLIGIKPLLHPSLLSPSAKHTEGGPFSTFPKTASKIPPYMVACIFAEHQISCLQCKACNLLDVGEWNY